MHIPVFLLAVFVGRMLRWLALSLLVLKLGTGAVDLVARHAVPTVLIVSTLAVAGFAWWWIKRKRSGKLLEG
jgi:membrane protein DedA with SNARE-associated domain